MLLLLLQQHLSYAAELPADVVCMPALLLLLLVVARRRRRWGRQLPAATLPLPCT